VVDLSKMTEDDTQMSAKLDEKLPVQQAAPPPPPVNPNPPADKGPAQGAVTHPGGGSETPPNDTPTPPADKPADKPAETPPPAPTPSEKPAEPEPNFNKQ
jgi:hypothetical protein